MAPHLSPFRVVIIYRSISTSILSQPCIWARSRLTVLLGIMPGSSSLPRNRLSCNDDLSFASNLTLKPG
jgi:hypothetical protein